MKFSVCSDVRRTPVMASGQVVISSLAVKETSTCFSQHARARSRRLLCGHVLLLCANTVRLVHSLSPTDRRDSQR